jgi:cell division protein FtsL
MLKLFASGEVLMDYRFIYLFIYLMNLLSNLHTYYIRYKDKNLTNERQKHVTNSQISRYAQTKKHKRDTKSPMRGAPRN